MMNILLVVVPRYGAYLMTATGAMMLFSNFVYYWLLPSNALVIHIEDVTITFELGWCYWLILIAGKKRKCPILSRDASFAFTDPLVIFLIQLICFRIPLFDGWWIHFHHRSDLPPQVLHHS